MRTGDHITNPEPVRRRQARHLMAGRHAAEGMGDFVRGLTLFILKWFLFGAVVFLIIWAVIVKVPEWFPSEEAGTTQSVAVQAPTTTLERSVVTEPPTTQTGRSTPSTAPATSPTTLAPTTTQPPFPTTTTTTQPVSVDLSPAEITVRVLNSTTRGGLAATVTSNLAALGYRMLEQNNYTPALDTTTVFYVPGYDIMAADLAAQLPGAVEVEPNPSSTPSADLLVVLGASYP